MVNNREITPELLARLSILVFTRIPYEEVLSGRVFFDNLSERYIANLMLEDDYFGKAYSKLECTSYAQCVIDYVAKATEWQGRHRSPENRLNAFDLLLLVVQDLLTVNDCRVECQYQQIYSWRLLTRYLGEELAVCARYAMWDHQKGVEYRDDFDWPYVLPHNNKQLHRMLRRGIAEHHCHLWATTPYFHVSWINLMNNVTNSDYARNLCKLFTDQDNEPNGYQTSSQIGNNSDDPNAQQNNSLPHLVAAWIRLYLCEKAAGHRGKSIQALEYASFSALQNRDIRHQLLLAQNRLQSAIKAYSYTPRTRPDYAINISPCLQQSCSSSNYEILTGERWLYYSVFQDYCTRDRQKSLTRTDYNLFFAYFLIRIQLRSLMVQNNDRIGFDNFQKIQSRKGYFHNDTASDWHLTHLTINEALKKPYIREMEVRITPAPERVKWLDTLAQDGVLPEDWKMMQEKFYYVFHFIKQSDLLTGTQANGSPIAYRQERLRKKLLGQAQRILRFREQNPGQACRVLGIDTASQEIGCRPEVFATVFRLLKDHTMSYIDSTGTRRRLPALRKTYHVGEDFLDIVDGLRAIDEVVRFLNFDFGDRLGHALALGIAVEEWYDKKHRSISLSVQDYLDNLAWLHHALSLFSVPNSYALKEQLVADFEYWFRIVYRNNMADNSLDQIMRSARRNCYDQTNEDKGRYQNHTCHFDIMDYFRAWTLRGDDPSCYEAGFFRHPIASTSLTPYGGCKVNPLFPVQYDNRYVAEYSLLNFFYQFDKNVRREGERKIRVEVTKEYIQGVKAVQIAMRNWIALRGISIETNPTSNVLIGTFRKYEEHPILAFYNRGLPVSAQEEAECAQLQVSINTDNGGTFYTDLENEYALLASSVENILDENGQPRFKKHDIYEWLDSIREMGLDQGFRDY